MICVKPTLSQQATSSILFPPPLLSSLFNPFTHLVRTLSPNPLKRGPTLVNTLLQMLLRLSEFPPKLRQFRPGDIRREPPGYSVVVPTNPLLKFSDVASHVAAQGSFQVVSGLVHAVVAFVGDGTSGASGRLWLRGVVVVMGAGVADGHDGLGIKECFGAGLRLGFWDLWW